MNRQTTERALIEAPSRDETPLVGIPSKTAARPRTPRWDPVDVDEYDNFVDGASIEGRSGDYLFTVGNVSSGKSTIQSYLIHRLWSDPRISFEYATADGNPAHDAYLNGWVQNIGNGFFPQRTKTGAIREFTVRFGQAKRPMLDLGFIEIAGEEIRSIVPRGNDGNGEQVGLNPYFERYLREPRIRKRFLFVSDGSSNRTGSHRESAMYDEDILFDTLLRYLLRDSGVGLKRIEALFVAAKWDQVKSDYRSERHYFKENFPQTLATIAHAARIRASFMPFSVGEVTVDRPDDSGKVVARIVRKETKYVDTLISWIYETFTRRRLINHVKVRRTLWDRVTGFAAGIGDKTIASRVALYVCGVISNRQGFEYAGLGPDRLPGSPAQYLDATPPAGRLSHAFELVDVEGASFIRYSRYRRINPNDSELNRGAYVSVGFLAARGLSTHAAASSIDLVSQVFGHLMGFLGPGERFARDFKLKSYAYGHASMERAVETHCSPLLLLDVLMQGMRGEGALGWEPGKPIFFDPAAFGNGQTSAQLLYFDSGASGTLLKMDRERARIGRLTQKLRVAASRAEQVESEWLSYQSMIGKHLPSIVKRGRELREALDELAQLDESVAWVPDGRPKRAAIGKASVGGSSHEAGSSVLAPSGAAPRRPRAAPAPFGRRNRHVERDQRLLGLGARQAMLAGGGVLILATITFLAVRFLLDGSPPASAVDEPAPQAESVQDPPIEQGQSFDADETNETEQPDGAAEPGGTDAPPRDVARERAALGTLTRN